MMAKTEKIRTTIIVHGNVHYSRKDTETKNCKVYNQRPIACRIAGNDCLGDFWVRAIKEQHDKNKTAFQIKL